MIDKNRELLVSFFNRLFAYELWSPRLSTSHLTPDHAIRLPLPGKKATLSRRKTTPPAKMTTAAALLGFAALLLAIYCGLDPLRHRPFANFPDFDTHLVEFPPSSEIPAVSDPENLLQRAEIRFLNQIQGPESIVFDPKGRGPYTGVADGRVLFWDGAKWVDFAYTSPKRWDCETEVQWIWWCIEEMGYMEIECLV